MRPPIAIALAVVLLTGCGGGGGAAPPSPPAKPAVISSPTASLSGPKTTGTLVLAIGQAGTATSSSKRKAQFVSPSSSSVAITLNGGTPTYADVSATSPNCTISGSTRTCSLTIGLPAGAATVGIAIYDGANGTGNLLGSGSNSTTVTLGTPFTITIAVSPVVASASNPVITYATGSTFVTGTAGTATLTFTLADADGNTILASSAPTFASPLTLSSSDPHVAVSPTSWTGFSQTITLTYDGSAAVARPNAVALSTGATPLSTAALFPVTVSTLAGTGAQGFTNGAAATATFNIPYGVGADNNGNVYVADLGNNVIREITAAGTVVTFAGTGVSGYTDGPVASATFNGPGSVAVDGSGNIFVADSGNHVIRKITGGTVSTFAGTGTRGFMNGPATSATFRNPTAIAVASNGSVYVADTGNNAIRQITAGSVTTLAGTGSQGFVNGTGTGASFSGPSCVALDTSGNVYVADEYNQAIRVITPAGVVSTFAGTGSQGFTNGAPASASFRFPYCVAVDTSGNVYVADSKNYAIREISAGVVSTLAGTGVTGFTNGPAASATFAGPYGVGVDASGNVYVADTSNNAIRKIVP